MEEPSVAAYVPGWQVTQLRLDAAPWTDEAVPEGHAMHEPKPGSGPNVPGRHSVHVDTSVAPSVDEDDPTLQRLQLLLPWESAKVPGAQRLQFAIDDAPMRGLKRPMSQLTHEALEMAPGEGLYVPATQRTGRDDAAVQNAPTGHKTHAADADPALAIYVPCWQLRQALSAELPYAELYVPGGQMVHDKLPESAE